MYYSDEEVELFANCLTILRAYEDAGPVTRAFTRARSRTEALDVFELLGERLALHLSDSEFDELCESFPGRS